MSLRTILVGVGVSEGSRAALAWASELAAAVGAKILAAHVFEPLEHLEELRPGLDLAQLRDHAMKHVDEEVCRPLREAGIPYEVLALEGTPSEALADAAESHGADLLVIAARRHPAWKEMVLGSTARKVAHMAACPVTIVNLPAP